MWPSNVIWRQGSRSTLAQVMASCLMAPGHYLDQCWLIISEEMPPPAITKIRLKMTYKIPFKFPRGQWVKQVVIALWSHDAHLTSLYFKAHLLQIPILNSFWNKLGAVQAIEIIMVYLLLLVNFLHHFKETSNILVPILLIRRSHLSNCGPTDETRTTRMPVFWGYPQPPHDYPYMYYWFILDPKSKSKLQI